jgi:hypothetical protein
VPPPRRPLLAYHGLLGPRSRWKSAIVPKPSPDSWVDVDTRAPRRWPWARLLQRVFGFDVLVCDRCGGRRRILGAVTEPHAVQRLLAALGLAPEPPGAGSGPHLTDLPSPCRALRRALHSGHRSDVTPHCHDATPGRTPGRVAGARKGVFTAYVLTSSVPVLSFRPTP